MKQSHYEFPPSRNNDGNGQCFLFDVHHVDDNNDELSVVLTQGQIERMRNNRRVWSQAEAQRTLPENQPSVSQRAGYVAIRSSRHVGFPSI